MYATTPLHAGAGAAQLGGELHAEGIEEPLAWWEILRHALGL